MPSPVVGLADKKGVGPFAEHVDVFLDSLRELRYSTESVRQKRAILVELGRWFHRHRLGIAGLDEERLEAFVRDPRRRCKSMGGVRRTGAQLLRYLRLAGLVQLRPSTPPGPIEEAENAYSTYLRAERGVADSTVALYVRLLRPFLVERCVGTRLRFAELTAPDVIRHVVQRARAISVPHAKLVVTALRSFLRFLHVEGLVANDLTASVPTVPNWRLSTVPKFISVGDVRRLLCACDRRTASGRRDYAILLLFARLGLRECEVRQLMLEDVHWRAGELLVRGKGPLEERIPLPHDVGHALAQYLRRDRPQCALHAFFIGAYAPRRALAVGAVSSIVKRAIRRAGIQTPSSGAHLLRHSLATHLLRRGGSLSEVGDLLRHRHAQTTLLYAKVDLAALRTISPPWPEVAR